MEINGKEIAVEQEGAGDAVIMVHGLGGTANTWYPQVGPLARFFRVVRLDLEGSGRSPATGALSIASFAADVIAVMDELDISTAHLCGHSMGTIVCQHIAAEWPERVKSLVLLGPLAEPPEPARPAIRDRAGVARKNGMVPIADTLVEVAISAETRAHHPASAAFVREILMRQDAEGYARTCEALAAAESADLSNIGCKTLLITGDEDGVSPPPAVKALGKRIKGSRVAVLPGCGHWTPIEKPTQVNGLLLNFYYSFN
ncbi:MAG: alpha/beta hydrolase [Rhodospirillaceae bacterium]|nr:alpha/beta hydrolase [Rhodospirillaceae bacterium]